jgi:hypothetical protein
MNNEITQDVMPSGKDIANEQPVPLAKLSIWRPIFFGTFLVVIDASFLNQGVLAVLVGLWMLLVGLPRSFLVKKYARVRVARLRNIAIYFLAVILVFVFNSANNHLTRSRAETLVSAVKAFHDKNQRYPKSLEELVPAYIKRVPLVRYTFTFNRFSYFTSDQDTSLLYVSFPPFGRRIYSFTHDAWHGLD